MQQSVRLKTVYSAHCTAAWLNLATPWFNKKAEQKGCIKHNRVYSRLFEKGLQTSFVVSLASTIYETTLMEVLKRLQEGVKAWVTVLVEFKSFRVQICLRVVHHLTTLP